MAENRTASACQSVALKSLMPINVTGEAVSLSNSSAIRMILIGEREAGKSAVCNAILGKGVFDTMGVSTREATLRQGTMAGRPVTVVDTPGWEWFPTQGSSKNIRTEIVRAVSMCQPGPHALLLVVPLSFTFSERERRIAEEHVQLIGEQAWRHTLVLFTIKGRRSRDASLREQVEESEELQALVDRCGGRFHALYSGTRKGHNDVAELLDKLEDMVAANGGAVLPSEEILEEAQVKEEEQEKKKQQEEIEREEQLKRVREALRQQETDEDTEEEGEGDIQGFPVQQRVGRIRQETSHERPETSPHHLTSTSQLSWSELKETVTRTCKTQ